MADKPFTREQGRSIKMAFLASEGMRKALLNHDLHGAIKMARLLRENQHVFHAAGIKIERELAWLKEQEE